MWLDAGSLLRPRGQSWAPQHPQLPFSSQKRGNHSHRTAGRFPACQRPSGRVCPGSECHSYESSETQGVFFVSREHAEDCTSQKCTSGGSSQADPSSTARGREPDPASPLLPDRVLPTFTLTTSPLSCIVSSCYSESPQHGCLVCLFFVCVFIIFIGV